MKERHQVGEIVRSRYCITEILGEGGLGITYAAEDLETVDRVALKALSFRQVNEWKVLELFEREAKILAQLDHPAIAKYLDYFQIDHDRDRDFYIVQELIEGKSLAQEIADGWHGSEADIKEIVEQVLHVLIYLHELKPPIIHRDIKPQNIILRPNGKIVIVDFGAVQDTYRNTQVGGSTVVGTYGYMPPEQFRGKAIPATDLYALGATVLFLLTGRSPADLPEVRFKINFRSSVNVSPNFANWLEKMIEPAIEDRCSTARQSMSLLQNLPLLESFIKDINNHSLPNQSSDHDGTKFRYPKPLGSRIGFKRNDDLGLLQITLLPKGFNLWGVWLLICTAIYGGILVIYTFFVMRVCLSRPLTIDILGCLIFIPFWSFGIWLAYSLLSHVFGKTFIVIGKSNFRLSWEVLWVKRSVKGKTEDLTMASILKEFPDNQGGTPTFELTLQQGIYPHKFGSSLSQIEKEWLTQEINGFLELLRSQQ
jgi:eukaryotic-like serine/threonine-protein kinase